MALNLIERLAESVQVGLQMRLCVCLNVSLSVSLCVLFSQSVSLRELVCLQCTRAVEVGGE